MRNNEIKYNLILKFIITLTFAFLFNHKNYCQEISQDKLNGIYYIKKAKQKFEKNQWLEGKDIIEKGLNKNPVDTDLMTLLGRYYQHEKNYDKARYYLLKSIKINPDNVDAKHILINIETETERYASAICYVNELLEINPYWKGLWRKKIQLYNLQDNTIEANRLRKRIMQIYPNDTVFRNDFLYHKSLKANTASQNGQLNQAIELREQILNNQPEIDKNYILLINEYIKAGDYNKALIYIEQALQKFPNNIEIIKKKLGVLASQKNYNILLSFLEKKIGQTQNSNLKNEYNYYLIEAARNARQQEPISLYAKALNNNNKNLEAFNYYYSELFSKHQYEQALIILKNYQKNNGNSKELYLREIQLHRRMNQIGKANLLTKKLFETYPEDLDIQKKYAAVIFEEAKIKMQQKKYQEAITDWNTVYVYGSDELAEAALKAQFNAHLQLNENDNALKTIDRLIKLNPDNKVLLLQKADVFLAQKKYKLAADTYHQGLVNMNKSEKKYYAQGYQELIIKIIKQLDEKYQYDESFELIKTWIKHQPRNKTAYFYAVNYAYKTKQNKKAHQYILEGYRNFPDENFFKIKKAEIEAKDTRQQYHAYQDIHKLLKEDKYNPELSAVFATIAVNYSKNLINRHQEQKALAIADTAIYYAKENKTLKYLKGIAFENLKKYDSAYYYQAFYEPSLIELNEHKTHLNYLFFRSQDHEIAVSHIRSRYADNESISAVSSIEYTRFNKQNIYRARVDYTGRNSGKGIKLGANWLHEWSPETRTELSVSASTDFFPTYHINLSGFRYFEKLRGIEAKLGLGLRRLRDEKENMLNLDIGFSKTYEKWRISSNFSQYLLFDEWLYNLSANLRHYISTPKNYIMATASLGTSPDIDIIENQFTDAYSYSLLNTMVGFGGGVLISKSSSIELYGTWHNFNVDKDIYKDFFTLNLQLNVAF